MNSFSGPIINKIRGGLGRTSDSGVAIGLIGGGVATGELPLNTIAKITSLADAELLEINAAYDATNLVLVYNTLKRIFLYAPEAIVYLVLKAGNTALDTLDVDIPSLVLHEDTNREITLIAGVLNPAAGYTPTYTTGLDAKILTAIDDAQTACVALYDQGIFIDNVMLDGRLSEAATLTALPNLRGKASEYVSVVIAQDPALSSLDAAFARSSDVGSAVGMLCARRVSECLGSADIAGKPSSKRGTATYPLTVGSQYYATAQITSGKKFSELTETEKESLDTLGYIYAGRYEGMPGYFFSDSHTCILATDDYAFIEDNRVWNKAARLVREALLPTMKGQVEVDPTTGFLSPTFVKYMEGLARRKLAVMSRNAEISGTPTVTIPTDQNIVSTGKVSLSVTYARQGILRVLEADVYAINPSA